MNWNIIVALILIDIIGTVIAFLIVQLLTKTNNNNNTTQNSTRWTGVNIGV